MSKINPNNYVDYTDENNGKQKMKKNGNGKKSKKYRKMTQSEYRKKSKKNKV